MLDWFLHLACVQVALAPTISQTAAGTSSTAHRTDTNADAAEVIQRGLTSTTMKNISNESEKGTGMI
jgi:hypothetical protein